MKREESTTSIFSCIAPYPFQDLLDTFLVQEVVLDIEENIVI